jgi:hypothetical protein
VFEEFDSLSDRILRRGRTGVPMRLRIILAVIGSFAILIGPFGAIGAGPAAARPECTIRGTAADDTLVGTGRGDVICAGPGRDRVWGLAGADFIAGGTGDDELHGNDGADTIRGKDDDDTITGNGLADRLYGGQGDDQVDGGFNDDIMSVRDGVDGNDAAIGDSGTDTCFVDAGDLASSCEL